MSNFRGSHDKGLVYVAGGAVLPYTDRFDAAQSGSVLLTTYTPHSAAGTDNTAIFVAGLAGGTTAYISLVLGAATSVEVKFQTSYDGINWADIQSVPGNTGIIGLEASYTATGTYALQTASTAATIWTRLVAKYTGASVVGTELRIAAVCA